MNARVIKFALSILFLSLTVASANATTYTVDNKTGSAAQYTDLQTAIDAAQPGDTLLIAGSPTSYGSATIRKQLTLIGAGYSGLSSKVGSLSFRSLTANSDPSGSFISGFDMTILTFSAQYLNTANQQADSLMDFTVERNKIANIIFEQGNSSTRYTFKRFQFKNNLFSNGAINIAGSNITDNRNSYENINFSNNIFDGSYFNSRVSVATVNGVEFVNGAQGAAGFVIRNNFWTNRGSAAFNNILGAVVENNIFYGVNLIPASDYTGLDSLSYTLNFNNNITFLIDQDLTANSWFAVGSNNINVDPLFVDYPADGEDFSPNHDYQLQAGSPAIGAGVNGEDLGIYGGTYPWPGPLNLLPKGSIVTEFEPVGSPSVPSGGTVEFRFKSTVNN